MTERASRECLHSPVMAAKYLVRATAVRAPKPYGSIKSARSDPGTRWIGNHRPYAIVRYRESI